MTFEKVERNLRRLRRITGFEGAPGRWRFRQKIESQITPTLREKRTPEKVPEEIKEATRRFVRAFFRARGFLPENPLAAKDELRKAIGEMEIIKQVLVREDYQHIKTMLSEIEDFLGKHEIESAIAKMEALWTWMLTKVFPPPPYIASPFPLEMKGSWVQIPPDEEIRRRKVEDALWWLEQNYGGKKVILNPVAILMENQRLIAPHDEEILVEAMKLAESKLGLKFGWWKYEHYKRIRETKSGLQVGPESQTLELKYQYGSELRRLIEEAQSQNREVGVMLCQTPSGGFHLSRECWGRRETVTVADCHDGLSPLGSFHVHLSGTGVFSVPDLELAIKKEQLSCLGYVKAGVPTLKCILPKRFYELPPETRAEIRCGLNDARQDIERATQLYRTSPTHPEALVLSRRAQQTLNRIEQLLGASEVGI